MREIHGYSRISPQRPGSEPCAPSSGVTFGRHLQRRNGSSTKAGRSLAPQSCCAPKTNEECCAQWMSDTAAVSPRPLGQIWCCAGSPILCIRPGAGGTGPARSIVAECIKVHEQKHLQQNPQCDKCTGEPNGFGPGEECEAYRAEVACLRNKRGSCKTMSCREQ